MLITPEVIDQKEYGLIEYINCRVPGHNLAGLMMELYETQTGAVLAPRVIVEPAAGYWAKYLMGKMGLDQMGKLHWLLFECFEVDWECLWIYLYPNSEESEDT